MGAPSPELQDVSASGAGCRASFASLSSLRSVTVPAVRRGWRSTTSSSDSPRRSHSNVISSACRRTPVLQGPHHGRRPLRTPGWGSAPPSRFSKSRFGTSATTRPASHGSRCPRLVRRPPAAAAGDAQTTIPSPHVASHIRRPHLAQQSSSIVVISARSRRARRSGLRAQSAGPRPDPTSTDVPTPR